MHVWLIGISLCLHTVFKYKDYSINHTFSEERKRKMLPGVLKCLQDKHKQFYLQRKSYHVYLNNIFFFSKKML